MRTYRARSRINQPSTVRSEFLFVYSFSRNNFSTGKRRETRNSRPRVSPNAPKEYSTKSSFRKALFRASKTLPKNQKKRRVVIVKLYEKHVRRPFDNKKKIARPRSTRFNSKLFESARKFYERESPGARTKRLHKDEGWKWHQNISIQIKYLLYPVRRVCAKYCVEIKGAPLKLSNFFALRPRHIISAPKLHIPLVCARIMKILFFNTLHKIIDEVPEYGDDDDMFYYKTFFLWTHDQSLLAKRM